MFYVIDYESGETRYGEFNSYSDAVEYAESDNSGNDYTISEYDSEEDYFDSL